MSSRHHIPFLRPKPCRAPPTSDSVASGSSSSSTAVSSPSRASSVETTGTLPNRRPSSPCATLDYDQDDCEVVQGLEVISQYAPSCPYERFYDIVLAIHNLHRISPMTTSLSLILHAHMINTLPLMGLQYLTPRISQAPEKGLYLLELYLAPSILRSCHIAIDILAQVTETLVGIVGANRVQSPTAKCGWVSIARVVANAETTLRGPGHIKLPESDLSPLTIADTIRHAGGGHPNVWGSSATGEAYLPFDCLTKLFVGERLGSLTVGDPYAWEKVDLLENDATSPSPASSISPSAAPAGTQHPPLPTTTQHHFHNRSITMTNIDEEIKHLVTELQRLGAPEKPVKFGTLVRDERASNIFEALNGTLRAAKRRKVIDFQGEMLLQGAHDDVDIVLLEPLKSSGMWAA
ncbi:hypothetical protein G7K_3810-t1 [Saitoella complicata NRRL Y-17804]|uniref:Costars domain-containing protein n=1 Tax=Saitoella complicata (strain BCRC 22490 / CBS 7301 / JCM 7358 / NBRC 10748 / NRRL Y-17804) TaxID=698492 RepID=A0A0E9NIM3_SAICN|nr:hypothetical protein G7K_3810-t1 [Saitoella complicata NRRL Y-17804]